MKGEHIFNAFGGIAVLTATLVLTAGSASAESTSAKMMKITDDADPAKMQIKLLIKDDAIQAADGYAAALGDFGFAALLVMSRTTNQIGYGSFLTCESNLVDELKCTEGKSKLSIKPGIAKVRIKGSHGYELDALVSQTPIVMVLGVRPDSAPDVEYCAVCGDGGSDVVKKDGSDGKQVQVKNCELAPCTEIGTPVCCATFTLCAGGLDKSSCIFEFGGTPGAPGTICDASETCVTPPAVPGGCCQLGVSCFSATLAECSTFGSGVYSNASTCDASGSCSAPPSCPGPTLTACGTCGNGSCFAGDAGNVCLDTSMPGAACNTDLDCPAGTLCGDAVIVPVKNCYAPCF